METRPLGLMREIHFIFRLCEMIPSNVLYTRFNKEMENTNKTADFEIFVVFVEKRRLRLNCGC